MEDIDLSGIYQIRNLINGHIYIGSAKRFRKRWQGHVNDLKNNCHENGHLQNAFTKYGEANIVFEILEFCPIESLIWLEQQYLDQWEPEYNICTIAGSTLGVKPSEESRQKMSISGKKRQEDTPTPEEQLEKMHVGHKKYWEVVAQGVDIISPDGVIYRDIKNRRLFSKEHNLNQSGFNNLCRGIFFQYKGWRLLPNKDKIQIKKLNHKIYPKIVSPEGMIYEISTGVRKFCKEHNLIAEILWRVLSGNFHQHRGWKLLQEDK